MEIIFSLSPWLQHPAMRSPVKDKVKRPAQTHVVAVPIVAPGSPGEVELCSYRSASKNLPFSHSLHFFHAPFLHSVPSVIFFPLLRRGWASSQDERNTLGSQSKRQASLLTHTWPKSRGFTGLSASLPLDSLSGLALAAAMLLFFINQAESCGRPSLATCPQPSAEGSKHHRDHKSWPSDAIDSYSGSKKSKKGDVSGEKNIFLALLVGPVTLHCSWNQ